LCSLFSWGGDGCAAAAAAAVPGGDKLDSALTSFVSFGDQVTFGASRMVRHRVGLAGAVDECSAAYNNIPAQVAAAVFMFANGEGEIAAATRISELAVQFGRESKEIREAIHGVKGAARFPGNPDVAVARNGEVHPIGGDGKLGDSIGNIFDFLRGIEMRDGWSSVTVRLEAQARDIAQPFPAEVLSLGSLSSPGTVLLIPVDTGGASRLQERMTHVREFLLLHEDVLLEAASSYSADVFIGWSPLAPQESLTLDSSLLQLLASLSMDLVFDTYSE
jgi:hypothetical protein